MPYVASIGTYLPCWGAPHHRVPGDDEDAITLAVEAGRAASVAGGAVERVVLVSRHLPLLESSNAAVLLAGLGLDPELEVDERLHERGLIASLEAAWLDTPAAVAGVDHDRAAELCIGIPPRLPTSGASSSLFALAGMADAGTTGPLVAVEQAILSGITVSGGAAQIHRREPAARPMPESGYVAGADIPISLAAYERAFEAKVRWEAGYFADSEELDFPPRYRVGTDGALATDSARGQASVLHGRHDAGRCGCGRSSRFLHGHRADQL